MIGATQLVAVRPVGDRLSVCQFALGLQITPLCCGWGFFVPDLLDKQS